MIVIGQVTTADGLAMRSSVELSANGRAATEYRDFYAAPAHEYNQTQPDVIGVDVDHEGPAIGEVLYLCQRGLGLFAVVEVIDEAALPDPPWYFSAELEGQRDSAGFHDITLHRLAVVERSATVAKSPAVAVAGSIDDAHLYWDNGSHRPLLREAAEYCRSRRYRGRQAHVIASDRHAPPPESAPALVMRSAGPLELRSASTADVSMSARTITIIAAPTNETATVVINGKLVGETFTRGAFAADEQRADRIRVNRDHDLQRTVGRATRLDPHDQRGCVASLKIARTVLGDETLALAADGCLDASAGFRVLPGGEVWDPGRTRRSITKGTLDHIALLPNPAYTTANVLDVRSIR